MKTLNTVQEVIEELGGRKAVAELADVTRKAVHVWSDQKAFPSKMYLVINTALASRGCRADVSIFNFTASPETEAAE